MNIQGMAMDVKTAIGTAMTGGAAWLDYAEPIVTITVTLLVGGATLWYTIERAIKLRKERKG
jgi:hypothetical protein